VPYPPCKEDLGAEICEKIPKDMPPKNQRSHYQKPRKLPPTKCFAISKKSNFGVEHAVQEH
jgi:hypothetical protein